MKSEILVELQYASFEGVFPLTLFDFGGEFNEKPEKCEAFLASVSNSDSSNIVHVSAGPNALSEVLIGTSLFTGETEGDGSGFPAVAASGGGGYDFGVDPNLDPELALALAVTKKTTDGVVNRGIVKFTRCNDD
ncbi:hypothetical protein MKW98_021687 [Papaver atlanticum]|uniref:Uncharacterized protein n=1 Tax=Papaver atlanticum TaxID=357466 RepID=A0AAD4S3E8_9MAGN|nr:hypothetical protein MKW98_021687 [Papaver atlanticum]